MLRPRLYGAALAAGAGLCLLGGLSQGPGCGGRDAGEQDPGATAGAPHLVSLRVTPDNDVVQVDLDHVLTKRFTVTGLLSNGQSQDYTGRVRWSAGTAGLGTFTGSTFHSASLHANQVGFTRVYARIADGGGEVTGIANLTLAWLRASGPSQDFFFELPYQQPAQQRPLVFSTQVQSLDVFFAEDTTGSMGGEIGALVSSLQNTIIPGVKAAAARDAWFGVGSIDDFPAEGHGNPGCNGAHDQPFILLQPMTNSVSLAQAAMRLLLNGTGPAGCGGDLPEGQIEALYQIATGAGNVGTVANVPAHSTGGLGGVGFRDGALPVVVTITDAVFHTKGEPASACAAVPYDGQTLAAAHTRQQSIDAMNRICAKMVGISALRTGVDANCLATADLTRFANATGAVVPPEAWDVPVRPASCAPGQCCTGLSGAGEPPDQNRLCPLVFKIPMDGTALGQQVTSGISQLARFASFDVAADVVGQRGDAAGQLLPAAHTTADFIKSIAPLDALPPPPPPLIPTPILTAHGFSRVVPGSYLRFNVEAVNDIVPALQQPQVFHATIRVRAGGCADLDQRDVIILIPPAAPVVG